MTRHLFGARFSNCGRGSSVLSARAQLPQLFERLAPPSLVHACTLSFASALIGQPILTITCPHGCGAFKNEPSDIARVYKRAAERHKPSFAVIAFAIFYAGHGENNYSIFKSFLSPKSAPHRSPVW